MSWKIIHIDYQKNLVEYSISNIFLDILKSAKVI